MKRKAKNMTRSTMFILIAIAGLGILKADAQTQPITIQLNGNNVGQNFDGIGSVFSYEKLFYDYPKKQRNEILDYLFKPKYGAALQILKVEIGYDGNNTTTSWPAHQRELNEKPNYNRGFVWWLMEEAKKRNPKIKLAGLHWGYPAYANTDELKADFIYKFVEGAKNEHNLFIDYIGGNQNETRLNIPVTILLRKKLDENGFKNVKIVAADEGSRVENYMSLKYIKLNPEYNKSVDIIGMHYKKRPVSSFDPTDYNLGKKFWSSEDRTGPYDAFQSGYDWVNQMFKLFVELKFSAATTWLATSSAYDNMPHSKTGMIKSKEPWSGHYELGANLWAFAHVTQFTRSGWKILNANNNSLYQVGDNEIGKYIGFKDPQSKDFSLLINTDQDDFPVGGLDVKINVDEALKNESLNIWRSDFHKNDEWFIKKRGVNLNDGSYTIHLDKNCVYTISTLDGGKGETKSPPEKNFKLPYIQTFENKKLGDMPVYFVDANGTFEIANGTHGNNGKVLRQVINTTPELWHHRPLAQTITEMGDIEWKDYSVEADFLLEESGNFWMSGRFDGNTAVSVNYNLEGYWFKIDEKGDWELLKKLSPKTKSEDDFGEFSILKIGKLSGFNINKWMHVKLSFKGNEISVELDHQQIVSIIDDTYANGNIAFGTIGKPSNNFFVKAQEYLNVQIDNLKILPL